MQDKTTIKDIILKLSSESISNPEILSQYLVLLTSNLWKYGQDTVDADIAYAKKWQEIRNTEETDGRATMRAKTTEEYRNFKMAQVSEKTLLEVVRSLKRRLVSISEEYKAY